MNGYELTKGKGRTKANLSAYYMGSDLVVRIFNENAHIGAVALGEYDYKEGRASCSLLTRLGHKDDIVAQKAAYLISKHTKKPVCVITGIHLDDITKEEIEQILKNTSSLVDGLISQFLYGLR
ncbi:hypothetical protein ACFLVC_02585 [Chloroflexota bacterium]